MENYIDMTMRFWSDFSSWHPPLVVWYTIIGFGLMAAWIVVRFVSAPPVIVAPVSFAVLTYAAMITNFSARAQVMMGTSDFQKALCFTVLGHVVAAFALLAVFRVGQKSVAK